MTARLSVDPMADKYPSFSPYHYCHWNPMLHFLIIRHEVMVFEPTCLLRRQLQYLQWPLVSSGEGSSARGTDYQFTIKDVCGGFDAQKIEAIRNAFKRQRL